MAAISVGPGQIDKITLSGTAYTTQELRVYGTGHVDIYADGSDVLLDFTTSDATDNTSADGWLVPAGQAYRVPIPLSNAASTAYTKVALWSATASAVVRVSVVGG